MSVGLLDFFVLEASDYVDRLQRLASTDEPRGPDAATLLKLARGLRGSAVMAKLGSFADAASGVERGGRLLHEGRIAWTTNIALSMLEAVAELRALIPMARLWGESHDERARSAGDRLTKVLDDAEHRGALMQSGGVAAVAAAASKNSAVRAFFDSIDHAARPTVSPTVPPVFPPAQVATTPATRSTTPAPSARPVPRLSASPDAPMPIVPIASLAPNNDTESVVFRAPNPAISFAQRFVADVSPLVGSLRARLAPLRQGAMQEAGADMMAAFRPVLVSLRDIGASYQYDDVRTFCDAVLAAQAPVPAASAGALDSALSVILQQDLAPHVRAQRLAELRRVVAAATPLSGAAQSEAVSRPSGGFPPPRPRTPLSAPIVPAPSVARTTPPAPSGRALNTLLSDSLEKVRALDATPLDLIAIREGSGPPVPRGPDGEPDVVHIDTLLYRGPRALSRARHIVGQLRSAGATHDQHLINELFDLVELAGSAT